MAATITAGAVGSVVACGGGIDTSPITGYEGGNYFNKTILKNTDNINVTEPTDLSGELINAYQNAKFEGAGTLVLPGFHHAVEGENKAADIMNGGTTIILDSDAGGKANQIGVMFRGDISGFYAALSSLIQLSNKDGAPKDVKLSTFGGSHNAGAVDNFMVGYLAAIEFFNKAVKDETIKGALGIGDKVESASRIDAQKSGPEGDGKIISETQFSQSNIVMAVAGPQTKDALDAAKALGGATSNKYVVGVDTNQSEAYAEYDGLFTTSAEKALVDATVVSLGHSKLYIDKDGVQDATLAYAKEKSASFTHKDKDGEIMSNIVELKNIHMIFNKKIIANEDVNLSLQKGEIHALMGENGAGKSTLMSVLFGIYNPTKGKIFVKGKEEIITSPIKANRLGIEIMDKYNLHVDLDMKAENATVGMKQRTEILKVLYQGNEILVFDEPTAVLTPQEIEGFLDVLLELQKNGKSIILITHKMAEIQRVANRATVLRKGKSIGTYNLSNTSIETLSEAMIGRKIVEVKNVYSPVKEEISLEVKDLIVRKSGFKKINQLDGISFNIKKGEIVAIAGVEGNGQLELAEAISGMADVVSGKIELNGADITNVSTSNRFIQHKMAHIPEDRHKHGLVRGKIQEFAQKIIQDYDVRNADFGFSVARQLSGGNQQKMIVGREMSRNSEFYIIFQPTRGLDVGSIEFIHSQILKLKEKVYGLFGIGLAIGFKVGLFNMSGSGQAVISMGMTGIVLIKMFETQPKINMASPALIVLILIIMVGMSMLMSSIIGYKFKLIGTQPEAGRYVGINFKKYIISATAIQGLCIGLGSFVYWSSLKYSYSMNNDLIPTIGFDSLAISLIAFNNILVAVTTFPELGREVAPLIFGFIVYSTTFATLVARVRPVSWIKYSIYLLVDRPMKIKCRMHKEEIKVIKNKIKLIKSNEFDNEYPTLKSMHNGIMKMHEENVKIPKDIADEFAIEKEEALIILRKEILVLKSLISELKEKGYEVYKKNSYRGMIIGFKNKQKRIKWDLLNPAIKDLNELRDQKILVKEKINLLLNSKKIETNSIKLNIKNLKKQIKDIKKNKFNNKNEDLIILKNEIDLLGKDNLGLIETKKAQLENNKEKIITELNNKIMLLENKIQEILQRDDSENLQKIIELKKELPEFKLKEDNLNEN
ncbi:hypothetical protein FQR65_LT16675 [Abscondita terminalis]|nr:hypothetical protein FQR65_LT16675 [Abscondita terminalis]